MPRQRPTSTAAPATAAWPPPPITPPPPLRMRVGGGGGGGGRRGAPPRRPRGRTARCVNSRGHAFKQHIIHSQERQTQTGDPVEDHSSAVALAKLATAVVWPSHPALGTTASLGGLRRSAQEHLHHAVLPPAWGLLCRLQCSPLVPSRCVAATQGPSL
jgi:hypothetical protein